MTTSDRSDFNSDFNPNSLPDTDNSSSSFGGSGTKGFGFNSQNYPNQHNNYNNKTNQSYGYSNKHSYDGNYKQNSNNNDFYSSVGLHREQQSYFWGNGRNQDQQFGEFGGFNGNNSNFNVGFDNGNQFYNNQENEGFGFNGFINDNRNNFNQGYGDNNNGWGNFQGNNEPRGRGGQGQGYSNRENYGGYNGYF